MDFEKLKDPLIVSAIFFLVASDWFDNWLKDLFPRLREMNGAVYTLIKTAIFAGIYWLYHMFLNKKNGQRQQAGQQQGG